MPIPTQWWIAQDGDAGTMLTDFGREPDKLPVLGKTMYSAAFHLLEARKPKVLVIGVGGATDLWAAKIHDCSLIRGIELNQGVLDVHTTVARDFSAPLLADPRVQLVCDEGRSALMREDRSYDVVQLTGIDTWTALNSGAYVLAENYLYTVEACRTMYDRLTDGGILQVARMAAGMETIRLMNNMRTALPPDARAQFAGSVAALKTVEGLLAVLLKKGTFTPEEVDRLERFADDAGIEKIALPGRRLGSEAERFVLAQDHDRFVAEYPFDVRATTDDWPYFFSFLRWGEAKQAKEFLDKPTSMVQGNPLFLWYQLLGSALAAAVLILLPMLFRRGTTTASRRGALPLLVYFAGLGIGFIGIEVALIQKFTLLLGQPLYSIVVTLFAILIFTGVGSFASRRLLQGGPRRPWLVPVGILVWLSLIAAGSSAVVDACIALPLWARAGVTVLVIAPVAFLLGVPFAHGIAIVEKVNPSFVPWAWAVNGSTTVVGSIATVILSMRFGFSAVLLIAAAIYLVAFAAIDRQSRSVAAAG
jgi:spermidine synthase